MRSKTIPQKIKAMSLEHKILGIVSLTSMIACFFPWYGINSRVVNQWWNAFGSIGSVAGYIVFSFALISFLLVAVPAIKPQLKLTSKLPVSDAALLTFLQLQSFFVSLIFIPVYSQYSLINATNSGTRFGIYIALLSTLVGTIVGLSSHRKQDQLQMRSENFANVPRQQHSLNEWDQVNDQDQQIEDQEMLQQEAMFESALDGEYQVQDDTIQSRYQ